MSFLPETSIALANWGAQQQQLAGMHLGPRLAVDVPGIVVSEIEYDPVKHIGLRPNPLSFMGLVTGQDYIDSVMPTHPLAVNVVVHHDPAGRLLPDYLKPMAQYKQWLGEEIAASVRDSLTGYADRTRVYVVGDPVREEYLDQNIDVIANTEDPEAAAEAAAEICVSGLTFVVSDFNNFPLHTFPKSSFANTVAIKANHMYELALPANMGRMSIHGLKEVNTESKRERTRAHAFQAALNSERESRLSQAGIEVARVIISHKMPVTTFYAGVDREIADAISAINKR